MREIFVETIYVRVFEERMDLIRAAIIGAPGTPYHDGLFFFDIFLPPEYPQIPPVSFLIKFCILYVSMLQIVNVIIRFLSAANLIFFRNVKCSMHYVAIALLMNTLSLSYTQSRYDLNI